jgi:hypothetical protein
MARPIDATTGTKGAARRADSVFNARTARPFWIGPQIRLAMTGARRAGAGQIRTLRRSLVGRSGSETVAVRTEWR